jgi:microcystin-dependent protein
MNSLSVTNLKSIQLLNQAVSPGSSSLYMLGNNLYWADGTGSYNVQITSGNAVAVSGAVGFSGLPSGTASAAYVSGSGTFRFQSATNTGATLDIGPLKTRNTTASSNAVTITPPNPLAADYTLTLPGALPSNTSFVQASNTGALSFLDANFILPAGIILMTGATSAPTGWLFCDGSVVSQTTYANLYAAVGSSFNTGGEGAGNFRLPNFQRKVPMGAGGTVPAGAVVPANTVGSTGGTETVTLSVTEMPSHDHGGSTGSTVPTYLGANSVASGGSYTFVQTYTTTRLSNPAPSSQSLINSHVHSISSQGGGGAHSNTQPSLVVNYIIKY